MPCIFGVQQNYDGETPEQEEQIIIIGSCFYGPGEGICSGSDGGDGMGHDEFMCGGVAGRKGDDRLNEHHSKNIMNIHHVLGQQA